ncbi:MAG TPA: regulatory protein RecX, partial [Candidatus Baltobacteraceae bacterium]|nr:regulatory protein RecX [Candidatus Baltobacteraceae bacterium]
MAGAHSTRAAHRTSLAERRERRAAVEDPAVVLDAAAAFLAVRPRSIGETRRRLETLGYRSELIEHVIDRLTAYGYLDDAAFGRAWLESRDRARPRGSHVLRSELLAKGLERELVTTLLAERDGAVADLDGSGDAPDISRTGPDLAAAERLVARR